MLVMTVGDQEGNLLVLDSFLCFLQPCEVPRERHCTRSLGTSKNESLQEHFVTQEASQNMSYCYSERKNQCNLGADKERRKETVENDSWLSPKSSRKTGEIWVEKEL